MNTIHWYPGHMAKAMRGMEENLSLCDGIILVLDARAPASSYNPKLRELVGERAVVYVLNKGDLADLQADALAESMKGEGRQAIKLSALDKGASRKLLAAMERATSEKREKFLQKGMSRPMRFFVAGVPNTGKSTLINLLAGQKKAQVGDRPGVTKNKQWVKAGNFELMDTPGTMPPYLMDQTLALRLAFLGCINDDILKQDEIALALLKEMSEKSFEGIFARYRIERGEPLTMLENIAKSRGFLLKGGEADFERTERTIIDDFRKGKLGRVTLDAAEDLKAVGLLSM